MSETPKFKPILEAADKLSLGISIVVAILMGVGIGIFMYKISGIIWLLWLGIFWGVAAAFLNIYKMYKKVKKDLDDESNKRHKYLGDDDEDY